MEKRVLSKISLLLVAITCFTMLGLVGCTLFPNSESQEPAEEQIVPFEYVVSFVIDNTVIESQTVKDGQKVTKPSDPVNISPNIDYKFEGWYNGDKLWDFDTICVKSLHFAPLDYNYNR